MVASGIHRGVSEPQHGMGREMFANFRAVASGAETGAITFMPGVATAATAGEAISSHGGAKP